MSWKVAKCPSCGGDLNVETDQSYIFCTHCGTKLIREDDRIIVEHVDRKIDETENKRIEFEEKKFEASRKGNKVFLVIAGIAAIALVVINFVPELGFEKYELNYIFMIIAGFCLMIGASPNRH